ncbi:MAG: hypothetical protein J0M00_25160 [Burkholderiales bacterium]|nr:hypothetical protein [Burkholderiales bacterium]
MNKGPQEEAGTPASAEPVKQKQQTPEAPPVGESKPLSATEELRVKELAFEIAGTIKAKDGTTTNEKGELEQSHDDVEYAALIYRDGDTLKATRLYTDNQTSQTTLTAAFAEAGGKQNVVGIVHNHPKAHVKEVELKDGVSKSQAVAANRLPSEPDWDLAKKQFDKRKDVTHFILDPDGQLRAYDTEDRQKWLTHLKGPQVGPNKGNPDLKSPPALDPPPRRSDAWQESCTGPSKPAKPVPLRTGVRTPAAIHGAAAPRGQGADGGLCDLRRGADGLEGDRRHRHEYVHADTAWGRASLHRGQIRQSRPTCERTRGAARYRLGRHAGRVAGEGGPGTRHTGAVPAGTVPVASTRRPSAPESAFGAQPQPLLIPRQPPVMIPSGSSVPLP